MLKRSLEETEVEEGNKKLYKLIEGKNETFEENTFTFSFHPCILRKGCC